LLEASLARVDVCDLGVHACELEFLGSVLEPFLEQLVFEEGGAVCIPSMFLWIERLK